MKVFIPLLHMFRDSCLVDSLKSNRQAIGVIKGMQMFSGSVIIHN